jgi:hypothetical protein
MNFRASGEKRWPQQMSKSGIEFDAHQEEAGFFVGVFAGMQMLSLTVDEVGMVAT